MTRPETKRDNSICITRSVGGILNIIRCRRSRNIEISLSNWNPTLQERNHTPRVHVDSVKLFVVNHNSNENLINNFNHSDDYSAYVVLPNEVACRGNEIINSVFPDSLQMAGQRKIFSAKQEV